MALAVQRNYYIFAKQNKILISKERKTGLKLLPQCQLQRDGNEEQVSEHAETQITLHKVHHLKKCTHQTSSTVAQSVPLLSKLPLKYIFL